MSDDQILVRITADASGVESGIGAAVGEINGLTTVVSNMGATTKRAADEMKSAMAGVATAIQPIGAETQRAADEMKSAMAGVATAIQPIGAETQRAADKMKSAMAGVATAIQPIGAETQRATTELVRMTEAVNSNHASAGQMRFAVRDLGYQISDISTQVSMGTNGFMIFAQQGNQVVQSLALMQGEAKGLVGFLGGIWGQVLLGAVSILGMMYSAHEKAAEGSDVQKDAAQDLAKAIDALHDATEREMRSTQASLQVDIDKANSLRLRRQEARKAAVAELELAREKAAGAENSVSIGAPGYSNMYNIGEQAKQEAVARNVTATITALNGQIAQSEEYVRLKRGQVIQQQVHESYDAAAAAAGKYERTLDALNERLTHGKISEDQFRAAIAQATETRQAEEKAAQASHRTTRQSHTEATQLKREEARQEREKTETTIAEYKLQLEAARGNMAERLRITQEEANFVKGKFGEESKEYKAMQAEIVRIKRDAAAQIMQIETIVARAKDQGDLAAIDDAQANARFEIEMGRSTYAQLLQQDRQFEMQRFEIHRAALARELSQVDPKRDPVRYAQINAQIAGLETQHQGRLTQIDRAATLQRTQIQRQAIQSVASSWSNALGQMMTGQMSFAQGIKSMWQGLLGAISQALIGMIENWLVQQLTALIIGQAAQSASGLAMVTSHAAVAGSAAYASTAAIPIIGPALAPAAAMTAFAGAMAFAPLASAEGGDWQVREGMYNLHKDEMVLPAWAASPLRSMIQSGNTPTIPSAANDQSGGTMNVHIHAADADSVKRLFHNNKRELANALRSAARDGVR